MRCSPPACCTSAALPGVLRPAIALPLPTRGGVSLLIDGGANADCRPEHLAQFAVMGSVFCREILEKPDPTVRLLSIGEEPEKGNQLTIEAHALLAEAEGIRFEGNAEARDLLRGAADVVVTDGFTGNVALKLLEGGIKELLDLLREEISATATGKLGGLLIRPAARRLRARLDPDTYGGAYLLGLNGLAVIAHGNSGPSRDRKRDRVGRSRRRARGRPAARRGPLSRVAPPCMIGALSNPCNQTER